MQIYRRRLEAMVDEFQADVAAILKVYSANTPRIAADADPGLYVRRRLVNSNALWRWARDAGIPNLVPPHELHVTIVRSRAWIDMDPEDGDMHAFGGERSIARLGDRGAVVLMFEAPSLAARWSLARAMGATWDFDAYHPHVTLSYDAPDVDAPDMLAPAFPLMFGPEIHGPVVTDWAVQNGFRGAQDASPADTLRAAMRRMGRLWQRRLDKLAPELAAFFATAAAERASGQMASMLRKAGFTVKFSVTPTVKDILDATVGENVSLIKSIAAQHLTNIEGAVMRSVTAGRDLSTLSNELKDVYGVTRRRAANIALDQNNKATAAITRARQEELGITEAIWQHSRAGKHPRQSHLAFDGHRYDVKKGAFLDGKWVWPGTEINCRCTSRSVIPGF